MDKYEKVAAYYEESHPFKEEISMLRELVLKTELEETYKWNFPTYTLNNKNVLSICKFKNHFGIWFFNGVFLSDSKKVLRNAQESKTQSMRQWKFNSIKEIEKVVVQSYVLEAIENQKKGLKITATKNNPKEINIPTLLLDVFKSNPTLKLLFEAIKNYKQKEYYEYINSAKQEKTKLFRLEKIIPLIEKGIGLNDRYKK